MMRIRKTADNENYKEVRFVCLLKWKRQKAKGRRQETKPPSSKNQCWRPTFNLQLSTL